MRDKISAGIVSVVIPCYKQAYFLPDSIGERNWRRRIQELN